MVIQPSLDKVPAGTGKMMRRLLTVFALLFWPTFLAAQPVDSDWSEADVTILKRWVEAAPLDALPVISTRELDNAVAGGDAGKIDEAANALALKLARMHLLGAAGRSERSGWNIVDSDNEVVLEPMLEKAVEGDTLNTFFALLRPAHAEYSALRAAYAKAAVAADRRAIALNMERWRWMPRSLGEDYVLVNAAAFNASVWRAGSKIGTWRTIVGKKSTPTPVFKATIEGVIFNPWWEIPASIVRESVGSLVRRNPSLAKARGYVWSKGQYRQRPGPNNALGQMKLVMPNPYSVYMHDTPNKDLFGEEVRAFSHGCIRTDDAIGYAATLLEGVRTRQEIDEVVSSLETTRINLSKPVPVYITYFTAVSDGADSIRILPDIYGRDKRFRFAKIESECSASA